MTTQNRQNATTTPEPDDALARERRRSAQLADELEAARQELGVTTFVVAQGGTYEDARAVADAVEAERRRAKAAGAAVDWTYQAKLALHERRTAAGQPSHRPVDPKGEPMHPDPARGRMPRTTSEEVARREANQRRLRELRIQDPATQPGYAGDLGSLSGGGPIPR